MSVAALRAAFAGLGARVAVRYLTVATLANLGWELLQLRLYTLWQTARSPTLAYAVVHCTAGDLMLLAVALAISLLAAGDRGWPARSYARVALLATLLGIAFTVFGEWLNVEVLRRWAYAPAMPLLPLFGTGLSPLLQWIVIPPAVFAAIGARSA